MAYVASNKIVVFPSAKRGVDYPGARLTTEQSFVRIVNKLIDTQGFVISSEYNPSNDFEFNIYGYYFCVQPGGLNSIVASANSSQATEIYAGIKLTEVGGYEELNGQDDFDEYQGVEFDTEISPSWDKSIMILQKKNSAWGIPSITYNSKFYQNSSLVLDDFVVDGGTV